MLATEILGNAAELRGNLILHAETAGRLAEETRQLRAATEELRAGGRGYLSLGIR